MERNDEKSVVEETDICFCAGAFPRETRPADEERVLILGADGWKRRLLARSVSRALAGLGESEPICFRADSADLERYYVLGTPALVIGGTVVSVGCVLSRRQARIYLERYLS